MITLLSKIFVKSDNLKDPVVRERYGKLCCIVGIALNVMLSLLKFIAGMLSGAIAVTADALNNLSDAGSSVVTLIGFKMAAEKPDRDHPYGHGRMEYISGIFVAVFILFMAYEMIKSSIEKIIHPMLPKISGITVVVLIISIFVKLYMTYYNHTVGKKIDSVAMLATAKDSISDVGVTAVVLVSVIVGDIWKIPVDGVGGLLVGIMILHAGINATKETIDPLLGKAPNSDMVSQIEDIVLKDKRILGMHDLLIHDYGPGKRMLSLHVEVPYKMELLELHELVENIEYDLRGIIGCEPTIHTDPVVDDDCEINETRKKLEEILKNIDDRIKYHDYHMVRYDGYSNIIFDAVIPHDLDMSETELKEKVSEELKEYNAGYRCIMQIDLQF